MASLPRSFGRAMTPGRAQDEHMDKSMANGAFSMSSHVHSACGLTLLHQDSLPASATGVEYTPRSVPHRCPYFPLPDRTLRDA